MEALYVIGLTVFIEDIERPMSELVQDYELVLYGYNAEDGIRKQVGPLSKEVAIVLYKKGFALTVDPKLKKYLDDCTFNEEVWLT